MIKSLLELDVQKHVEKKNGLSYLSWAWAWAEALKADPAAKFHVDTFQRADATTVPYMDINGTAMVWVRTTLFGKEMTCFLPVMDHRNKPIPNPDAFQVNTAIMRCMTKCLALHGLGLKTCRWWSQNPRLKRSQRKNQRPRSLRPRQKVNQHHSLFVLQQKWKASLGSGSFQFLFCQRAPTKTGKQSLLRLRKLP